MYTPKSVQKNHYLVEHTQTVPSNIWGVLGPGKGKNVKNPPLTQGYGFFKQKIINTLLAYIVTRKDSLQPRSLEPRLYLQLN